MFTAFPNQISNNQRFGPPALGGRVNVLYVPFAYNDTGIGTYEILFTIPYTAEIVGITQNITTAFDGTGDNTLDYGNPADTNAYGDGFDASVTGQVSTGFIASTWFTPFTEDTSFTVIYNGTSASAGAGTICVFYIMRSQS